MRAHFPIYNLTTSVIADPGGRYNRWGSNRYRGNCDGRLFADLVLRYNARSVADPMIGSGTTQDCINDLNAHGANIEYWGGDLKLGFNLVTDDIPGTHDLVWIHPPYWNLIRYSSDESDLSNAPNLRGIPRAHDHLPEALLRGLEARRQARSAGRRHAP